MEINYKLTVALSTFGDRINNLLYFNFDHRVEYIILWQSSTDNDFSFPSNVSLLRIDGHGVALSRNKAIANTKTDWIWFMDDDVFIPESSITHALSLIEKSGSLDVFISSVKSPDGGTLKKYNVNQSNKIRTVLNVGTIQIIANINQIKKVNARFPINMGAGTENNLCDEPVFLNRLLKNTKDLKFIFSPALYVVHPAESSGGVYSSPGSVVSRAMLFRELYGFPFCVFASIYFLLKHGKKIGRFWPYVFLYKKAK
ncbi:glycosyltransferase [Aeromonas caviae]|uniref:glycosyltransferase n=1 Tax=Aeromonas caviae TaxID=648 RepID=UPI00132622E4|nr:glycosyltransferase [Aeromonas caviae]MXQ71180.1 glycosyltransferase [Aeromonas caviae]